MESLATYSSVNHNSSLDGASLTPYSDAIDAAHIILYGLTDKMKTHLNELLGEPTSESLHHFRIAIRKIRSLLGQLDDVLPEPGLSYQQSTFKNVMDRTSLLRDIEVCNLMMQGKDGKKSAHIG